MLKTIKFKTDVWNFFQGFQDKVAIEFGTHKGQTTRILSFLFKKVYTINNNDNTAAKELNQDRDNIIYLNFDLYSNQPLPIQDKISMFLIDAGHDYTHVISDINLAFSLNLNEDCYIVFDDYGFLPDVRNAVNSIDKKEFDIIGRLPLVNGNQFVNELDENLNASFILRKKYKKIYGKNLYYRRNRN